MASEQSEILGIHQSDVIIRSAIIAGINDLRNNPFLLDYVFASLPRDALTAAEYGEAEVTQAKRWFQNTNISVYVNVNPESVKFPCITITLMSSNEQEAEDTLADIHYVPHEDNDGDWPTLIGPIDVVAKDPVAGTVTLDPVALGTFVLAPGMILLTKAGKQLSITSVIDNVVTCTGALGDLSQIQVKPSRPAQVATIESALFRETYALGCHSDSEPVHLTYLHSVVVFVLLCYRQTLLEARGFERSTVSSTDFKREEDLLPEVLYSRFVTITGTVRQIWPKLIVPKIQSLRVEMEATNLDDTEVAIIIDEDTPFGSSPLAGAVSTSAQAVYYGVGSDPGTVTANFVIGLGASTMALARQRTIAVVAGSNQYVYYAFPAAFGGETENFVDGETDLYVGVTKVATVVINDAQYSVWRTNQPGLGALQIVVT